LLLQHIEIDDIQELVLMRNTNSKFTLGRTAAAGALLLGAAFAGQAAMACTLDNWSSSSGAVAAGDPLADGITRYSGLCGMEATGTGYVQDDNPGGIDRIVARFYFLADNTSTSDVYAGYGDGAGGDERFDVSVDASGNVTLTDATSTQSVSQAGVAGSWNSIEIDWAQGAGTGVISLSVNGATPSEITTLNNSGAQLQSVRLGNLNGSTGTTRFDAYESRRSTAVGRLLVSDANDDGTVNVGDITGMANEIFSNTLAIGQPDCNEDGLVDVGDITCAVNIIF
jgi:hypothetical protein